MSGRSNVATRAGLFATGIAAIAWLLRPDPALVMAVVRDPQGVVDAGGADEVFLVVAQLAFTIIAGWLIVATSLIACADLLRRPQMLTASIRLAPAPLRGVLSALLGLGAFALTACASSDTPRGLPATTTPVYAASSDAFDWPAPAESSSGPTGAPSTPPDAPPTDAPPTEPPSPTLPSDAPAPDAPEVTVKPGDCLWSIAKHQLGAQASSADIAELVDALYSTNAALIGANPDLLRPGLTLSVPAAHLPTT